MTYWLSHYVSTTKRNNHPVTQHNQHLTLHLINIYSFHIQETFTLYSSYHKVSIIIAIRTLPVFLHEFCGHAITD